MAEMFWQTHWGWIKPRAELLDATGQIIGGIEWVKWTGSLATGRIGNRRWTMQRIGFFQNKVAVREEGSDKDLARYHPTWMTTGVLQIAGGQSYRLHSEGFFRWDWHWTRDGHTQAQVSFHTTSWMTNSRAEVKISDEGRTSEAKDLLVLLGRYLLVMQSRDAAASGSG